ncbi:histidine phosphatase family protein [Gloeocapsa sp. PCC 73106]|uniref:histidine phosphatase family protein n=1 Tax=Gloeocapsa sp. PCC 73106 TaxID=102232 RepID=UPI0002ABF8B5|nr:histidine phosphatase family protein [Gloeocapsa sp. PCC 73106]ELR99918.1 fructose-2,6-bisphosphatase [Gloeocapsa sp. PCC 73106]
MNSLKVFLVRHGLSTYNTEGRYQGCSDESILTPKGLKAAYQTGLALKDYQFDVIYSSPLQRAQQTIREILRVFPNRDPAEIILDDRLKEVNMFSWEGLTYEYVKNNFPQAYQCWEKTPHLLSFSQDGKPFFTVLELYQQGESFWQDLVKKYSHQTILIIAHGGTNRALISAALGLSPDKYHTLQQSNCGISYLEFKQPGAVSLYEFNSTLHLGETLPKLKEGKQGVRYLFMNKESQSLRGNFKLENQDLPCQNILTNNKNIQDFLNQELLIKTENDYIYIIHAPTEDRKILQGILPLEKLCSEIY